MAAQNNIAVKQDSGLQKRLITAGHAPHLDLFGAFRDAIAAMMAIDMLERFVARVPETAVHLQGPSNLTNSSFTGKVVK